MTLNEIQNQAIIELFENSNLTIEGYIDIITNNS